MNLVDYFRAIAPLTAWMCWTGYRATRYLNTKKVTYPRYTVDIGPEKFEPNQTQITAGVDRLDNHGNVSTHTVSMETIKTHWNSVVSTTNAWYCTSDISNMYLCSNLDDAEYVRFPIHLIPSIIIAHYGLQPLISNVYVYVRLNKAWYELKQSGKIAHDNLVAYL